MLSLSQLLQFSLLRHLHQSPLPITHVVRLHQKDIEHHFYLRKTIACQQLVLAPELEGSGLTSCWNGPRCQRHTDIGLTKTFECLEVSSSLARTVVFRCCKSTMTVINVDSSAPLIEAHVRIHPDALVTEEDWSGIIDPVLRRKLQNRVNQRAAREWFPVSNMHPILI